MASTKKKQERLKQSADYMARRVQMMNYETLFLNGVQGSGRHLHVFRGGLEQRGKSDHQKTVWLWDLQGD